MRILVVCTGNICRSPTAAAVLRRLAQERGLALEVDSAGTHDYHVGEPPDRRAQAHARRRGYDLSSLRARQVARADFESFDLVLAMDGGHLAVLRRLCPGEHRHKLRLFMDFAPGLGARDVPDPYCGGPAAFEQALDLIETASHGLLDHLRVST